ncbi:DUF4376 domain-containing protein [Methylobacterium sp. E-065]|uniref:DUF4376 domain-containing protein n=1 Tax=Methylobacterium sp. E-065 TaxID=2836583 RepID=UPI001FBC006A|nr:DUF4376 domain-containing protein [Methylobacterium sp. E-065]MCJ2021052.1 DUF4376 domain-containing protein [Methylobacterium sp. E-065]
MMRVDAKTYGDVATLQALGAVSLFEVRGKDPNTGATDALLGYDVLPDIDLMGYAAKAAALAQAALVAYAEGKQAGLMEGGFAYNVAAAGQPAEVVQADTDLSGRLNLAGLVSLAQLNANFTSIWVQAGGGLTLTAPEIIALGQAVGSFVVQTYQALATVLAGIASGSIASAAQIDAAAWPAAKG